MFRKLSGTAGSSDACVPSRDQSMESRCNRGGVPVVKRSMGRWRECKKSARWIEGGSTFSVSRYVEREKRGNVETAGRDVPFSDVADAVEEGAGAENDGRAVDVLAVACDDALDGFVG